MKKPPIITITLVIVSIGLVLLNILLLVNNKKTQNDLNNASATINTLFIKNTVSAKATAYAHITMTANAYATASAIPGHNATATAIAIASQYPFSYTPHQFQLRDLFPSLFNLSSNNHGWNDNEKCKLETQGYLVTNSDPNLPALCFAENTFFSNFTYELHFIILKGDCGGIIFRASSDETNFYAFLICQDGSYRFVSSVNGMLLPPSNTGPSSAISKGLNSYNTIGVVARGSQLSFYIYQDANPTPTFIFSVSDNKYSQGSIGVITSSLHNKPTQVLFLGAKVWTLP